MKQRTIKAFSLLLFGAVCIAGCNNLRQEVNPDRLNREAAKLVVTCFLSPQDTVLAVKLTRTKTVLSDGAPGSLTDNNVTDATVTLSEGGRTVMLPFDIRLGNYQTAISQLPVVVGRTYSLVIQTPAGERAESTCTIPRAVNIASVTFDSLTVNRFNRQSKRYFIRASWHDIKGETNYYQFLGSYKLIRKNAGSLNNPTSSAQEEAGLLRFNKNGLQTDRAAEGDFMVSERAFLGGRFPDSGTQSDLGSQYKEVTVLVSLLSTDRAYYEYQDAVERQAEVSGNPFAEPVLIPSNIQGALGCFAAYNRSTLSQRLK
ncbi:MAG: hypothetical protein JWP57_3250 [Spirosoma sp.]|nr:hypothetical protein [Spirosoma sp.]